MNEFERRLLTSIAQNSWIATIAKQDANIIGIEYYNYNTISPFTIAAGATGVQLIQIQSDSDFGMVYMSGVAVSAGVVVTNPNALLQIQDTGTGKTFFGNPTLFPLVMGVGGIPFYLPAPRLVSPQTALQVTITNQTAGSLDFYVNFLGARIYYGSPPAQTA